MLDGSKPHQGVTVRLSRAKPSNGKLFLLAGPLALALALAGLVGCSATKVEASWANAYPSISEMVAAADAVVIGTAGKAVATAVQDGIPSTDFTFSVDQWLKGSDSAGTEILIHQTGGGSAGTSTEVGGDPLLVPGENDVLYLREYEPGKYFILGGPTGRNPVVDGKVTAMEEGIARDGLPADIAAFTSRVTGLVG